MGTNVLGIDWNSIGPAILGFLVLLSAVVNAFFRVKGDKS